MADKQQTAETPEKGEPAEVPEGETKNQEGKSGEEPDILPADTYEPEVRQRPWSNRQERAEFFKSKKEERQEEEKPEGEDDLNARVERAVESRLGQIVQEKLGSIASSQEEILTKAEISSFLADPRNMHFRKYVSMAEKAAKTYQGVPISFIFQGLAYGDAVAEGARASDEARKKGARHAIGGVSKRQSSGTELPDFSKMTPAQVEEWNAKIPKTGIRVEEE